MERETSEGQQQLDEQYFRQLIGRTQKTVAKVRRIDVPELLELAWVDGQMEPFAQRLLRSRPDLGAEVMATRDELRQSTP